jgi:hypothetical protein
MMAMTDDSAIVTQLFPDDVESRFVSLYVVGLLLATACKETKKARIEKP